MIFKILIFIAILHLGGPGPETYLEQMDHFHKPPNEIMILALAEEPSLPHCPPLPIVRIYRVHKCVTLRGVHGLMSMQGSNY